MSTDGQPRYYRCDSREGRHLRSEGGSDANTRRDLGLTSHAIVIVVLDGVTPDLASDQHYGYGSDHRPTLFYQHNVSNKSKNQPRRSLTVMVAKLVPMPM